jgi:iron complex outermembrane receptor protein
VVGADVDGRSTFRNAGRTQRKGVEADFQDELPGGFGVYAAYTYLDAKFAASDIAGNFLPGVPRQMVYTQLSWAYAPLGFKTSIDAAWRDRMYVNDDNSDFSNSYAVVNYQAGFRQVTGDWTFKEFGRIDNLLNRNCIGAVIVNASNVRYFEPEPKRNYMIGFSASYAF